MRSDMSKVLVERPRGWRKAARLCKRAHKRGAVDDKPAFESICPYRERKTLSDLLGPLRRFLQSHVGRPWDRVYSEMRCGLSPSSTLHQHIFEHVRQFVAVDVTVDARKQPWSLRYGAWVPVRRGNFYVHPRSGLLLSVRAQVVTDDAVRVVVRGDSVFARFGKTWFAVVMAPVPSGVVWGKGWLRGKDAGPIDVVSDARVGHVADSVPRRRYGRVDRYAAQRGFELGACARAKLDLCERQGR